MKFLIFFISILVSFEVFAGSPAARAETFFQNYENEVVQFVQSSGSKTAVSRLSRLLWTNSDFLIRILNSHSVDSNEYSAVRSNLFDRVLKKYSALRTAQTKFLFETHNRDGFLAAVNNTKFFVRRLAALSMNDRDGQILHYAAVTAKYALIVFDGLVLAACFTPAVIAVIYVSPVILAINVVLALPIIGDYVFNQTHPGHKLRSSLNLLSLTGLISIQGTQPRLLQ